MRGEGTVFGGSWQHAAGVGRVVLIVVSGTAAADCPPWRWR
jgi:hypothetical protein